MTDLGIFFSDQALNPFFFNNKFTNIDSRLCWLLNVFALRLKLF